MQLEQRHKFGLLRLLWILQPPPPPPPCLTLSLRRGLGNKHGHRFSASRLPSIFKSTPFHFPLSLAGIRVTPGSRVARSSPLHSTIYFQGYTLTANVSVCLKHLETLAVFWEFFWREPPPPTRACCKLAPLSDRRQGQVARRIFSFVLEFSASSPALPTVDVTLWSISVWHKKFDNSDRTESVAEGLWLPKFMLVRQNASDN